MANEGQTDEAPERQPILNLPWSIAVFAAVLIAIHIGLYHLSDEAGRFWAQLGFGFSPNLYLQLASLAPTPEQAAIIPTPFGTGWLPVLVTTFTHAFLHGSWEHLIFNTLWFVIFGTPVARRYGDVPMFVLFFAGVAAGGWAWALTTWGVEQGLLIGASGGIAALTGAATRFMFQPVVVARHPETGELVPLGRRIASITDVFINPRSRWFFVFWVGLNAVMPLAPLLTGETVGIAWQAHLGGFFAGFLLVPLFERRPVAQAPEAE